MSMGDRIRRIRKSKNLTLDDLVGITGLAKSTLSAIENNKSNPNGNTLRKISEALQTPLSDILNHDLVCNLGNDLYFIQPKSSSIKEDNPQYFTSAQDAMEFILSQPVIGNYGDFNVDELSDEDKVNFANDLLNMIKMISPKYKK